MFWLRNAAQWLLSVTLFASLFLTGCWKGIGHEVLATVLSVRGHVTYSAKGADEPHVLSPGARLNPGCSLQVSDGAEVDIALLPGVLLHASDNSELTIDELKLIKDGDETGGGMLDRAAGIRVKRGKVTLSYEQPEGTSASFAVVTDRVTVNAKLDSLFCIETDTLHTRVICVRGQIDALDATGKLSVIKTGRLQNWDARQSESILVRTDARTQSAIDKALQIEEQLRALEPPNAFPAR
jgi:hypothetical protein